MKNARSLLAAMLLIPVAGLAEAQRLPEGRMPGPELHPHGTDTNRAPAFFTFMNSEVARLTTGQLLVTPRPARGEALLDSEASLRATARRRAAVRILTGYEPVLAFMQELNALRKHKAESS